MSVTNLRYQQSKLNQKLVLGEEITVEDMELARDIARSSGDDGARVLFAKLKRKYMEKPIEEPMTAEKLEQMADKARKTGRLEDRVAYSRARKELEEIQNAVTDSE
jgi:hypothetical protein